MSDIERFKKFIRKELNGCWTFMGARSAKGYGHFRYNGRCFQAHRASWILFNGEITNGLEVLHNCDVRHCVNPEHLFLGTQNDNVQDMIAKGRKVVLKGDENARAKLTNRNVAKLRLLFRMTKSRIESLGTKWGIKGATAWDIARGRSWTHLNDGGKVI